MKRKHDRVDSNQTSKWPNHSILGFNDQEVKRARFQAEDERLLPPSLLPLDTEYVRTDASDRNDESQDNDLWWKFREDRQERDVYRSVRANSPYPPSASSSYIINNDKVWKDTIPHTDKEPLVYPYHKSELVYNDESNDAKPQSEDRPQDVKQCLENIWKITLNPTTKQNDTHHRTQIHTELTNIVRLLGLSATFEDPNPQQSPEIKVKIEHENETQGETWRQSQAVSVKREEELL